MGCCRSSAVQVAIMPDSPAHPVPDRVPEDPSGPEIAVNPNDSESDATMPDKIEELTVAIFGLDNAGKTCFLRSLCGDFNFDTVPSVGRVEKAFAHDDTRVKIYDIGGSASFRSVWARWYAEIWGFVYIVDSADQNRFEESKNVLSEMLTHPMMKYKPFVVVANKQDLTGAVSAEDVKKLFSLHNNVPGFDVSVITTDGENCHHGVHEAVSELVDEILRRWPKMAKKQRRDMDEQERLDEAEHQAKLERIQKRREQAAAATSAH
jgi:small GTP-binding protein